MKRIALLLSLLLLLATPVMAQDVNLSQFNNEPTAAQTQQAALEYAGLQSERLESMYTRAGVARLLPKNLTYAFRFKDEDRSRRDHYETTSSTGTNSTRNSRYDQPTDTLQHDIKAQWDLSGLIYNSDQLRVAHEMNSVSKRRTDLLKAVVNHYYDRRRLQIELKLDNSSNAEKRLKKQLAIEEKTAQLDSLTGGWFSQQLK